MTERVSQLIRVKRDVLAEAVNLSPRRVNQLTDDGVMTRLDRGEYDLLASMRGYIRHLQLAMGQKATMNADGETITTKHQRSALLDLQVARETLALAHARAEVMAIQDHELITSTLITETKSAVMAIAPRSAAKVANLTSRSAIEKEIADECLLALKRLSESTPRKPGAPAPKRTPAKANVLAKKKPAKKPAKPAKKKSARPSKSTAT